ncbi:hypothetical protein CDAR_51231 [Caerostris darwini]|uniref:Uncharacterized protein n=1 Tax=Caerostris darwini TaxID=1538125 RepID=A0AAV4U606_9ARAC|nr:hypothetical protein CDAR_51231 [Caerostris darwini]
MSAKDKTSVLIPAFDNIVSYMLMEPFCMLIRAAAPQDDEWPSSSTWTAPQTRGKKELLAAYGGQFLVLIRPPNPSFVPRCPGKKALSLRMPRLCFCTNTPKKHNSISPEVQEM